MRILESDLKMLIKIKNYQIYIDGQPLKKVEKLKMPIEKNHDKKSHYFRKKNWKNRGDMCGGK